MYESAAGVKEIFPVVVAADGLGAAAPARIDGYKDRIPLVNIASENVSHEKLLLKLRRSIAAESNIAALSYDHPVSV